MSQQINCMCDALISAAERM